MANRKRKRSQTETWYRMPPSLGFAEIDGDRVDREAGIIRGYVAMELGIARGHEEEADEKTLRRIVELTAGRRIKMRFGHPNASSDAIGTGIARGTNYRLDGPRVIGDAELLRSAKTSPKGNYWDYLLDLAEEDPGMFSTSFVITRDLEYRRDERGELARDNQGKTLPPLIRPTAVRASDFVDEGALTASLFSNTNVLLSAEATEMLDSILDRPDAVERTYHFLRRFEAGRPGSAEILRAALAHHQTEEPMTEVTQPEAPEAPQGASNEEALRQLEAAGYSVKAPAAASASPPPAPVIADEPSGTDLILAQLGQLQKDLAAETAKREALEAARAKDAVLAPYAAKLSTIRHLSAADRESALKTIEGLLDGGEAERAEAFAAAYVKSADVLQTAELDTVVSVPYGDEKRDVDISRYSCLATGEDGLPKVKIPDADREYMAAAALANEIEDPEERRRARFEAWKRHEGGGQ